MSSLTPRQTERRYLWTIVTWLFAALCAFALIHMLAPVCNSTNTASSGSLSAVESPHLVADDAANVINEQISATARRAAEEARARSRVRLQQLQHEANNILVLTKTFERKHDEWTALAGALLNDERGKRLATDTDAVQTYRALTQTVRPVRLLAEQVRERIATLMQPIQAALATDDSAYAPSDGFVELLERERQLITSATEGYARAHAHLEGLLFAVAQRTGTETLATVIERQAAAEARAEAGAVAVARGEAIKEVRQNTAEAEGTKVREIGRAEVERVKAEEDAEQARIDAAALRIRQQGERERLLMLAKDADIQARFAPFLATGRRYPARYEGSVRWLERKPWGRTAPRPVSLRELKTGGVLDNLECFVAAATSCKSKTGAQNDRPHWPMPSSIEWDTRRADFQLFQQLLPVWVELQIIAAD